ncbi:class I SAM-dependent methyltransferase [Longispora fulva]|uniref:Ubiquinone/menaquinone biosynthesis C-methylase UbiE n=2 Tax=Longispora fulva TaxID=619741 RepID=A0A8J7GAX4_9ACTN|nr:class I SAM-dependent methyltransferase [Longispora fulva]MBG6134021.1 ubiquinone/menaquinone biosynthesis C-methylase UbiE [Longispora fulva]
MTEFDSDETGRGDSYRQAQKDASVRLVGIQQLLDWAVPKDSPDGVTLLDVLGGDGTLARAVGSPSGNPLSKTTIVTGDISGEMVERALAHGLPAVRQAADFLFLRDHAVDGVLLAYGTHHIAPHLRQDAAAEAVRVVKPGGRVVLHDFEETSPMAQFFNRVVHENSAAGHDYTHFSRESLTEIFDGIGTPARVLDMYDPLIVRAATPDDARQGMCDYVGSMYGIRAHLEAQGGLDATWRLLEEHFDHTAFLSGSARGLDIPPAPVVYPSRGQFMAEVPRVAVVAVARKAG